MDADSALQYITLIWQHEVTGTADYFTALYYIAQNKAYVSGSGSSIVTTDRTYGYVSYEDGAVTTEAGIPIIEGVVNVNDYVSATQLALVQATWPNLTVNCLGATIDFEDQAVKTICVNNWGGATGGSTGIPGKAGEITMAQAAAVSSVGTAFKNNTSIVTLDLRAFIGLTTLPAEFISGASSCMKVLLPYSVHHIVSYVLGGTGNALTAIIGDEVNGSQITWFQNYYPMRDVRNLILFTSTPPYWAANSSGTKGSPRGANSIDNSCRIYVPDASVDTYKNSGADMWGNYASRIYPISEFEGEL